MVCIRIELVQAYALDPQRMQIGLCRTLRQNYRNVAPGQSLVEDQSNGGRTIIFFRAQITLLGELGELEAQQGRAR